MRRRRSAVLVKNATSRRVAMNLPALPIQVAADGTHIISGAAWIELEPGQEVDIDDRHWAPDLEATGLVRVVPGAATVAKPTAPESVTNAQPIALAEGGAGSKPAPPPPKPAPAKVKHKGHGKRGGKRG